MHHPTACILGIQVRVLQVWCAEGYPWVSNSIHPFSGFRYLRQGHTGIMRTLRGSYLTAFMER